MKKRESVLSWRQRRKAMLQGLMIGTVFAFANFGAISFALFSDKEWVRVHVCANPAAPNNPSPKTAPNR